MKRLGLIASLIICLCALQACGLIRPDPAKQEQARTGLDQAVAQLPELKDFTVVKIVQYDVYNDEHGNAITDTCYWSFSNSVIGTQLPLPEALDVYAQQLQSSGWALDGQQYETSRGFQRGSNVGAVVYSGPPGAELENAVDYNQLRKIYRNLIFLRLTYALQAC